MTGIALVLLLAGIATGAASQDPAITRGLIIAALVMLAVPVLVFIGGIPVRGLAPFNLPQATCAGAVVTVAGTSQPISALLPVIAGDRIILHQRIDQDAGRPVGWIPNTPANRTACGLP